MAGELGVRVVQYKPEEACALISRAEDTLPAAFPELRGALRPRKIGSLAEFRFLHVVLRAACVADGFPAAAAVVPAPARRGGGRPAPAA